MKPIDIRSHQGVGVRRSLEPKTPFRLSVGLKIAVALLLLGGAAASNAQDDDFSVIQTTPTLQRHVMLPSKNISDASVQRMKPQLKVASPNLVKTNVSGTGLVFTCDSTVPTSTCNYLNTTVAGYYNSVFTNANANIYIAFGSTNLGESDGYFNLVSYSKYVAAISKTSPLSSIQASALSSINTYAAAPYGSGNVNITVPMGRALGFTGLLGISPGGTSPCTPGTSGCYDKLITVANAASQAAGGFSLYYDDQGGTEAANQYDFYAVVQHEVDETFGTSSCISTGNNTLTDGCDFSGGTGVPSVVDLMRYSSPGTLALDTDPSTAAGQYFSFDGGVDYGVGGDGGQPKVYNTLANGDDFADYISSSPDCGSNQAIQDAEGCPGEDAGLTVWDDGQSEFTILNAIGFNTPEAVIKTPTPGGSLGGTSVTFDWSAATGSTGYYLYVGTTGVGSSDIFANTSPITTTSQAVTGLPTSGTVYVRLWSYINGVFYTSTDFTFKGGAASLPAVSLSTTSLAFGSVAVGQSSNSQSVTLTNTGSATLSITSIAITGTGASSYVFANSCGTSVAAGANCSIHGHFAPTASGALTAAITITDNANNSPQSITLSGTGTGGATTPTSLTSPAQGSIFAGPSVTFTWAAASGANGYFLHLGTTGAGSLNLLNSAEYSSTTTSVTVPSLPVAGGTIYARLFTDYNGDHVYKDYTFTASTQAALTAPGTSGTLAGPNVTFGWSAATGSSVKGYFLHLGTTGVGSENLVNSAEYSTSTTSVALTGLPLTGVTIYARIFTDYNGTHLYKDYVFTAAKQALLTSPAQGATFGGATVTFDWSAATGSNVKGYFLHLGTTGVGSENLLNSAEYPTSQTSVTVNNMPTTGGTVYARVFTDYNGVHEYQDYTFTAH